MEQGGVAQQFFSCLISRLAMHKFDVHVGHLLNYIHC